MSLGVGSKVTEWMAATWSDYGSTLGQSERHKLELVIIAIFYTPVLIVPLTAEGGESPRGFKSLDENVQADTESRLLRVPAYMHILLILVSATH